MHATQPATPTRPDPPNIEERTRDVTSSVDVALMCRCTICPVVGLTKSNTTRVAGATTPVPYTHCNRLRR